MPCSAVASSWRWFDLDWGGRPSASHCNCTTTSHNQLYLEADTKQIWTLLRIFLPPLENVWVLFKCNQLCMKGGSCWCTEDAQISSASVKYFLPLHSPKQPLLLSKLWGCAKLLFPPDCGFRYWFCWCSVCNLSPVFLGPGQYELEDSLLHVRKGVSYWCL